jgi:hypothetical protein
MKPESFSWYHPDDPICVYLIRPNFTSILKIFLFDWNVLGLTNLDIGFVFDVFCYGVIQRGRSPFVRIVLPSSLMLWLEVVPSDGIGILITPDLCLATSWLHDLIYCNMFYDCLEECVNIGNVPRLY